MSHPPATRGGASHLFSLAVSYHHNPVRNYYCPACGVQVDADLSLEEGRNVLRCHNCNFIVHEETPKAAATPGRASSATETSGEGAGAMLHQLLGDGGTAPRVKFSSILIAEDSSTLRELLKVTLQKHRIGDEVQLTKNGEEFVEVAARQLFGGSLPDLVILDVEMPVMNGYCAAIVLRALERAAGIASRVPILFFSGRVCDETFKSALAYCQPARYLNKGVSVASIDQIALRLARVLASLKA